MCLYTQNRPAPVSYTHLDVYKRQCQGYVEPCVFGEGASAYDDTEQLAFGLMYHGKMCIRDRCTPPPV